MPAPIASLKRLAKIRKTLLFLALTLALLLFGVDRYAAYAHRPAGDSNQVVLYTTTWCPYCKKLRTDLTASGISYVEHDVERSVQGVLGLWALRGSGVPVSAIGPTVVYGYDVAKIANALQGIGHTYLPARDPAVTPDAPSSSLKR